MLAPQAAVWRLSHHDKNVTDLTMSWALIADEGCRVLAASLAHNTGVVLSSDRKLQPLTRAPAVQF